MTKEEREAEKMRQKELRTQLQDDKKIFAKQLQKKELTEEQRKFFENKKLIDDLDEENEKNMRTFYQDLFPSAYLEELQKRIDQLEGARSNEKYAEGENELLLLSGNDNNNNNNREGDENNLKTEVLLLNESSIMDESTIVNSLLCNNNSNNNNNNNNNNNVGVRKHRRTIPYHLLYLKTPYKTLNVCENCRLPCHNVHKYPQSCPFPQEIAKKEVVIEKEKLIYNNNNNKESNNNLNNNENSTIGAEGLGANTGDEGIVYGGGGGGGGGNAENGFNSVIKTQKVFQRSSCAKCGNAQKGKMFHVRKHCELLDKEEKEEYEERHKLVAKLLEEMQKKCGSIFDKIPSYSSLTAVEFKAVAYSYIAIADGLVEECMKLCGLFRKSCIFKKR